MINRVKRVATRIAVAMGAQFRLRTEDRRVLEQVIFPYFVDDAQFERILFVGCDWYTRSYARIFADKQYSTMEPKHSRRWFGAPRHIEDYSQNVTRHFGPAELDVIFLNGVFGYGLDSKDDIERTMAGFRTCLRDGGVLVVGWNDVPGHRPVRFEDIASLQPFRSLEFPPLGCSRYLTDTDNRHIFDFYMK